MRNLHSSPIIRATSTPIVESLPSESFFFPSRSSCSSSRRRVIRILVTPAENMSSSSRRYQQLEKARIVSLMCIDMSLSAFRGFFFINVSLIYRIEPLSGLRPLLTSFLFDVHSPSYIRGGRYLPLMSSSINKQMHMSFAIPRAMLTPAVRALQQVGSNIPT